MNMLVRASCFLAVTLSVALVRAEVDDPASLAPATAALYVEVTRPDAILEPILAPSTYELAAGVPAYKRYLESGQAGQARLVVALLEARLGTDWRTAVRELVGGGVHLSLDPATNSILLISRSRSKELLEKMNKAILELAEADAKSNGRPSPVQSQEHAGVMTWSLGKDAIYAVIDDCLLISNQPDGLKAAIDRRQQADSAGLAGVEAFGQARAARGDNAAAWGWVGLNIVRANPDIAKAFSTPNNNPLGELLLAGVLDAARHADYAAVSLHVEGNGARLRGYVPRDASQQSAARQWYYTEGGQAPPAVKVPGTIATLSLVRDLAGFWLARNDLFNEEIVAGFAQADTQLGLFFSGRDFGTEVLGELKPGWEFIVARQEYADQPVPALKLPAMALVTTMKHPEDFAPHLLIAYQKVIGLTNIVGGQQGQPQLLLGTENYQGVSISTARYLPSENAEPGKAAINYNFSPACARVGDHFFYASTIGMARQLVDSLQAGGGSTPDEAGLSLRLDAQPLAAILNDNRELLITQNMLSEGHDRQAAEAAIGGLLDLAKYFEGARMEISAEPAMHAVELVVEIKPQ